jgi:hypothetical protein
LFVKSQHDPKLDEEIAYQLNKLAENRDDPAEYDTVIERVSKLEKLKSKEGWKPPSLDTVLVVGANIFGILWLAAYERENVIRSKSALGFVMKPRTG